MERLRQQQMKITLIQHQAILVILVEEIFTYQLITCLHTKCIHQENYMTFELHLLPPPRRLCFRLGLFVCAFVNNITQKLMDGFF